MRAALLIFWGLAMKRKAAIIQSSLIRNPKKRGEWVELKFMVKAAEYGLGVSKPWGDSSRYDFGVEGGGGLVRVQVKSTMCRDKGSYGARCVRICTWGTRTRRATSIFWRLM